MLRIDVDVISGVQTRANSPALVISNDFQKNASAETRVGVSMSVYVNVDIHFGARTRADFWSLESFKCFRLNRDANMRAFFKEILKMQIASLRVSIQSKIDKSLPRLYVGSRSSSEIDVDINA